MEDTKQKEVNITYETLFELLRKEKNREELQQLDDSFFKDVAEYLKEKNKLFEEQKNKEDLFAAEERGKAEIQQQNIKKILRELYERREKKIINMAIDGSRTDSGIIDTSAMLLDEKRMYNLLVELLNRYRRGILFNLLEANIPNVGVSSEEFKEAKVEESKTEKEEPKTDKVKFLHAVPKFVGPDLQVYGPFEENDEAELPIKIVDVLVNKGRVEEI